MKQLLYREWWAYVLNDSRADKQYGPIGEWFPVRNPWTGEWITNPFARPINWFSRILCRWRGHPAGVWQPDGSIKFEFEKQQRAFCLNQFGVGTLSGRRDP